MLGRKDTENDLSRKHFRSRFEELPDRERNILRRIAARAAISRDIGTASRQGLTFGERVADKVASFGGSWTFIFIFAGVICSWVGLNVLLLDAPPDPYPFILLNLILSMVAAIQAPVIMMSQNRQAANDRLTMTHDYEVNLKAELEIMGLHEKVDELRAEQQAERFAAIDERLMRIEAMLDRIAHRPT